MSKKSTSVQLPLPLVSVPKHIEDELIEEGRKYSEQHIDPKLHSFFLLWHPRFRDLLEMVVKGEQTINGMPLLDHIFSMLEQERAEWFKVLGKKEGRK